MHVTSQRIALRLSWSNFFLLLIYIFLILKCCARDQGSAGRVTEMKSDTQGDSGYIELP